MLLHAQGHSLRKIAKDVQVSRHSVREVIRSGQAQVPAIVRDHPLDPHLEAVRELYTKCEGNLVRVQEELYLRHEIQIAYSSLTRFCRRHLISEGEECVRDGQRDGPRGLEIDDQFELRGLFHG